MTSKTVDEATKRLWAVLASAAAKKAVSAIHYADDAAKAERFAATVEKWLNKAGANATKWYFNPPSIP